MPYRPLPVAEWNKLVNSLTKDEYYNLDPFRKRNCADCAHLKIVVSLWCGSEEAKKARGTAIPGVANCHYWEPDWKEIPKEYRTTQNGYSAKEQPSNKLLSWFMRIFVQ